MEQLDDDPLFRRLVGLAMDAPVWDAGTFSNDRDRVA
ncbi:MAG: transposase [Proteobacteria bacterium]|nr:transposase [Pseudomonadota bacterium]